MIIKIDPLISFYLITKLFDEQKQKQINKILFD